jgi:PPM family protein phosphatase
MVGVHAARRNVRRYRCGEVPTRPTKWWRSVAAPPKPHRRVRTWRPWLIGLGVLVLIVAALGGTYAWTQTQYFVSKAGADVAIYQGVNTEFGPLKFFNLYKVTDLPVANLNPSVRSQVKDGITASSKQDALDIVRNLRGQVLPACRTSTTPTLTPATSPVTSTHVTSTRSTSTRSTSTRSTTPTTRSSTRHRATSTTSHAAASTVVTSKVPTSPTPTCPVP